MRDWVVQPETWQGNSGAGGAGGPPHLMGSTPVNVGQTAYSPLTSWSTVPDPGAAVPLGGFTLDDIAQRTRFPETQSRYKALQTRGHIHWNLEPWNASTWGDLFGRPWRLIVSFRITVMGQEPDLPTPVPPLAYDLSNYWAADDTFAWHRETLLINVPDSEWSGTSGQRTRISGTIAVLSKVNRTIERNECLTLCASVEQDTNATSPWTNVTGVLRLRFTRRLRTYVVA